MKALQNHPNTALAWLEGIRRKDVVCSSQSSVVLKAGNYTLWGTLDKLFHADIDLGALTVGGEFNTDSNTADISISTNSNPNSSHKSVITLSDVSIGSRVIKYDNMVFDLSGSKTFRGVTFSGAFANKKNPTGKLAFDFIDQKLQVDLCYDKGLNISTGFVRPKYELYGDFNSFMKKLVLATCIKLPYPYSIAIEGSLAKSPAVFVSNSINSAKPFQADIKLTALVDHEIGKASLSYSIRQKKYTMSAMAGYKFFKFGGSIDINRRFEISPMLGVEFKARNITTSICFVSDFKPYIRLGYDYNDDLSAQIWLNSHNRLW